MKHNKFEFDTRILIVAFVFCVAVAFFVAVYITGTPTMQSTNFDQPYPIDIKIAVVWIDRDMTFDDYDALLEIQQDFIEYRRGHWKENWVDAGNAWDGWKTEFYARRVG